MDSLPSNPTYTNKALFPPISVVCVQGIQKLSIIYVKLHFWEIGVAITWWIERYATWRRFIINLHLINLLNVDQLHHLVAKTSTPDACEP